MKPPRARRRSPCATRASSPGGRGALCANGTNDDLAPVPRGRIDALAAALSVSCRRARSAARRSMQSSMRPPVASGPCAPRCGSRRRPSSRGEGANEGLGWQIDSAGRYWQNGGTGGFRTLRRLRSEDAPRHRHLGSSSVIADRLARKAHVRRSSTQRGRAAPKFRRRGARRDVRRQVRVPGQARSRSRRRASGSTSKAPASRASACCRSATTSSGSSRCRRRDVFEQQDDKVIARDLPDRRPTRSPRRASPTRNALWAGPGRRHDGHVARATSARTRSRRSR